MATFKLGAEVYQITRIVVVNNPGTRDHGRVRVLATLVDHDFAANLAWRADITLTADLIGGYNFTSWNVGTNYSRQFNAARVDAIDAAIAEYVAEIAADQPAADPVEDAATAKDAIAALRQKTIDRAIAGNVYITDAMVSDFAALRTVALNFVRTYRGENTFVQDIAVKLVDFGSLSIGQMRGALNVMITEAKIERAEDKADALAFDARHNDGAPSSAIQQYYIDLRSKSDLLVEDAGAAPTIDASQLTKRTPNGIYTIIVDDATDDYRTIKLEDAPEFFNAKAGTQVASYLSGADNETSYTRFAFVTGDFVSVWSKYRATVDSKITRALNTLVHTDDPIAYMLAYGMRFNHCGACGKRLSTPDSKRAGIGPVCAKKIEASGFKVGAAPTRQVSRQTAIEAADDLFGE